MPWRCLIDIIKSVKRLYNGLNSINRHNEINIISYNVNLRTLKFVKKNTHTRQFYQQTDHKFT